MGIKDLFHLLEHHGYVGKLLNLKDLKGARVAVDASFLIHMFIRAGDRINMLSSSANPEKPTLHILQIINMIHSMKTAEVKGIIFVFDHPESNPLKQAENEKRSKQRAKAIAESEEKEMSKNAFRLTGEIVEDCMFLLRCLGVPYMISPAGFEAEHVCATLSSRKIVDFVFTNDSDALTFGASHVLRKNMAKKKSAAYSHYSLSEILDTLQLSYPDFVKVCVVLGCDFAKKTKGIGMLTVLKKYKAVELTQEQQVAFDYFTSECPIDIKSIIRGDCDIAVEAWLGTLGFNVAKISPKLEFIMSSS